MAKRRLKKKIRYSLYGIGGVAAIVAVVIVGSRFVSGKKEEPIRTTTTSPYLTEEEAEQLIQGSPGTQINMSDFKIPQGDQIVISAISENADAGPIFSSSDESIVIVDNDGTVTAVAPGTAAISVTNGTKTESVIVEVIEYATDKGENNFPLYTEAIKPEITIPGVEDSTSSNQTSQSTTAPTSGSKPTQSTTAPTSGSKPTQSTTAPTSGSKPTQSTTTPTSGSKPTQSTTTPTSGSEPTQSTAAPTVKPGTTEALSSGDLYDKLEAFGFKKRVSNAFVFEGKDGYDGQVILSNTCVHIYIKNSTTQYEAALKEVLSLIVPMGYERVFNLCYSTDTDVATMTDGKKVQIIVGKNQQHRQIIVYN